MSGHSPEQLRSRRASLISQARSVLNSFPKGAVVPVSAETEFDSLIQRADSITAELQHFELSPQQQRIRGSLHGGSSVAPRQTEETRVFYDYLKRGMAGLSQDDQALVRSISAPEIQAAQSVGVTTEGGFAVPNSAMSVLVESMKSIGGLMKHATIIPSDSGSNMPVPTTDDTSNSGAILAENTTVPEVSIVLGQIVLSSYMYTSKLVRVSIQLMDDAAFPFGDFVLGLLGKRVGRAMAAHFITGTGTGQPNGIVPRSTVGVTAAAVAAVTVDELINLQFSVDPSYQDGAKWMMSPNTFSAIRKLKDTTGRPLYGELSAQAPATLLGHDVVLDAGMPAMTTGLRPILYGDLSNYWIRLVKGPRVLRLSERYADLLQLGFLAFQRADANLVDVTAVKSILMA